MSSLWKAVNLNLVVPSFVVFVLLRIDKIFSVHQLFFIGLRFFIPSSKRLYLVKVENSIDDFEDRMVPILQNMDMSLVRVDNTLHKRHMMSKFPFHGYYKVMVTISIGAIISYLWYVCYHCMSPTASNSNWTAIFVFNATVLTALCPLRVLALTTIGAKEVRIGIYLGLIVTVVIWILLLSPLQLLGLGSSFGLKRQLAAMAAHVHTLLQFISRTYKPPSPQTIELIIAALLGVCLGLCTTSLPLLAMRFARNTVALFNRKYGSFQLQLLSILDLFLPFLISFAFFPAYRNLSSEAKDLWVGYDVSGLSLLILLGLIRLKLTRSQVQALLDKGIESAAIQAEILRVRKLPKYEHKEQLTLICDKLKMVNEYTVAATAQYVSLPFLLLHTACLLHFLAPKPLGLCSILRQYCGVLLVENESTVDHTGAVMTALSIDDAPRIDTAMYLFLMGDGRGAAPTSALFEFARVVQNLVLFPPHEVYACLRFATVVFCLIWGMIQMIAVAYHVLWLRYMEKQEQMKAKNDDKKVSSDETKTLINDKKTK